MIFALKHCRPSLRLRLWLGALGLGALTLSGAGLALLGLTATERRAEQALAAQTRLEAWSNLSTQLNEWMLTRMIEGSAPRPSLIEAALIRLEDLTRSDIEAAPDPSQASIRAADMRHVAQMRSLFQQIRDLAPSTPQGRAGITFQLTHATPLISGRIEHETRRRDSALQSLEALRTPLRLIMLAFAIAAPLLLFLLWRGTLRPLFEGLHRVSQQAGNLTDRGAFTGPARHDEVGLLIARMRQAATRLARRRRHLETDLANLEALVTDRTFELRAANERLSAIDATRRRFFADVSHELRTPLTVIMGEAELGAMTQDPDLRQSFQTITARAERLFRRIEDLLRIARSETGELELALRDVPLHEVVNSARGDVAPLLTRAGVSLHIQISPDIFVIADPDWLRQMFSGFFENSVKFAGKGCTITVTAAQDKGLTHIVLRDDGKTPPPPEAVLFERHSRSAPAGVNGFGIGLALARWAARAFGGDLRRQDQRDGFALELTLVTAEGS